MGKTTLTQFNLDHSTSKIVEAKIKRLNEQKIGIETEIAKLKSFASILNNNKSTTAKKGILVSSAAIKKAIIDLSTEKQKFWKTNELMDRYFNGADRNQRKKIRVRIGFVIRELFKEKLLFKEKIQDQQQKYYFYKVEGLEKPELELK